MTESFNPRWGGHPFFGRDVGDARRLRTFCERLGIKPLGGSGAVFYRNDVLDQTWFGWRGRDGTAHRHLFETVPDEMSDEEWNLLKVKVRMTTC